MENISERHRKEWANFRKKMLDNLIKKGDIEEAKLAKAIADVLKVYQEGERRAWEDKETADCKFEITWLDAEDNNGKSANNNN